MAPNPVKRKLRNYIIDRGALARLSIPFFIMSAISIGTVIVMRLKVMHALESMEISGVENLDALNSLHDMQSNVTMIAAAGMVLLAASCFLMWIVYSHRIFGPTIPMRRHVHRLMNGDFSSRIHLRKRDEFVGLVQDLNRLAERLEETEEKTALRKA